MEPKSSLLNEIFNPFRTNYDGLKFVDHYVYLVGAIGPLSYSLYYM